MLRNLEKKNGTVEFNALDCCCANYNIIDELKAEGDFWQKYSTSSMIIRQKDARVHMKIVMNALVVIYVWQPRKAAKGIQFHGSPVYFMR